MRALIITVAGTSSRFSKSIGEETLKCIYSEGDAKNTLLYRIIEKAANCVDAIFVVGGFKNEELSAYIEQNFDEPIKEKIIQVYNPNYEDKGSGWSLHLAVEAIKDHLESMPENIIFAEGDLFIDDETFEKILLSDNDVITSNTNVIDASKSVAFYCDKELRPHYIYDVSHGLIEIKEPFKRIYNSGQVWGFSNPEKLFYINDEMDKEIHAGTNLELVNRYFSSQDINSLCLFEFDTWINCNTVEDYRRAFKGEAQ